MTEKEILACEYCRNGHIRYKQTEVRGRDWHEEVTYYHLDLVNEEVDCAGYKEFNDLTRTNPE